MSTSIHLQNYLASYDIGLAKVLRFARRVLELFPTLQWVISGRMAMILYAYMLNLKRPSFPNLNIDIIVNANRNKNGLTVLEQSMITLMEQNGFIRIVDEKISEQVVSFYHSIASSIRIDIIFNRNDNLFANPMWIENRKGKLLYPLENIDNLLTRSKVNVLRNNVLNNIQEEDLKEIVPSIKHHQINAQVEFDFLEYIKNNLTYNNL